MIKGVNRKVVEVSETQCEYFEKIMFFINPEYANISEGKIRERASLIANADKNCPPTKLTKSKVKEFLKVGISALIGAFGTYCFLEFI